MSIGWYEAEIKRLEVELAECRATKERLQDKAISLIDELAECKRQLKQCREMYKRDAE